MKSSFILEVDCCSIGNSNIMVYLLSHEDGEDNEEQVKEHDRAGEENM